MTRIIRRLVDAVVIVVVIFSYAPVFSEDKMTDKQIIQAATKIWEKQQREAWETLQRLKKADTCKCGESREYIDARQKWSDIYMAKSYFERMGR